MSGYNPAGAPLTEQYKPWSFGKTVLAVIVVLGLMIAIMIFIVRGIDREMFSFVHEDLGTVYCRQGQHDWTETGNTCHVDPSQRTYPYEKRTKPAQAQP